MANPIGQLKTKTTVNCTMCTSSLKRNVAIYVYENTPEAIKEAQFQLAQKIAKPYTCRICQSIQKSI